MKIWVKFLFYTLPFFYLSSNTKKNKNIFFSPTFLFILYFPSTFFHFKFFTLYYLLNKNCVKFYFVLFHFFHPLSKRKTIILNFLPLFYRSIFSIHFKISISTGENALLVPTFWAYLQFGP